MSPHKSSPSITAVAVLAAVAGIAALAAAPAPAAGASTGVTVWVANSLPAASTVTAYAAPGANVAPTTTLPVGSGAGPTAEAFDPSGDLWIGTFESDTIEEYAAASLSGAPARAPAFTISGGALRGAAVDGMAFDPSGNLWVSTYRDPGGVGSGQVLEFAKTASGMTSTPKLVIRVGLHHPANLAVDPSGDVWVTNSTTAGAFLVEYKDTAGSVIPRPAVVLAQPRGSGTFHFPVGMAFQGGNLWLANKGANQLLELSAASIAHSGDPTPAVTIRDCSAYRDGAKSYPHSLYAPVSLAFDAAGDLWVANEGAPRRAAHDYSVVEFTPGSLGTSGSPAPVVTLTNAVREPAAVVTTGAAPSSAASSSPVSTATSATSTTSP